MVVSEEPYQRSISLMEKSTSMLKIKMKMIQRLETLLALQRRYKGIAYKHTLFDIFKLQYLIFHPTCTLRTSEMILLNKHSHFGMSYMTRQWQYLQMEIACFTYHLHIYLSVRSVKSKLNGDPLLCKISYVSVFSNQVHKYCFKSFQLMKYLSKLSVC